MGFGVLAAILAAALLQAPQQFDLVCEGEYWNTPHSNGPGSPVSYRLRLDLEAGLWCVDECVQPRAIKAVTPDEYTLVDREYRSRTLTTVQKHAVNRLTGRHYEFESAIGSLVQGHIRKGECERAEFSGMPQPRL